MTEEEHPAAFEGGPYLRAAFFCERVLEEKDGVLSAVRLIDRIMVVTQGPVQPTQLAAITANVTLLLSWVGGNAQGTSKLIIRPEEPSGLKKPEISLQILFEPSERSANVIVPMTLAIDSEGLFWFDVLLEDTLVTRVPLRIIRQAVTIGSQP